MGIFDFFKKNTNRKTNENPIDETQVEFIEKSTNNAERLVSSFNERVDDGLDYSESSLTVLDDEILSLFSENKDDMDSSMLEDIIAQAGSYIFEVARRNYGGKYYWHDQLNQPILVTGQPEFEISILAFEKVKQRIENGTQDNIPFFFIGYSERVKKGKKGDKALIT
ncbi:hypothetical protein [Dokdonia sp. Dokd-P16]|uniref:hypothetical protein n=1 Tax=Dokdonia sp. Dokd-P16 TaxID=2173169 RepID=UPI0019515885|nr:hypothetical protein [Dokdonia sp. Dokd-P16]